MASKPETRFYGRIHKKLPLELHKEKMHNPFRGGTADIWYSANPHDLWVEYKWMAYNPRTEFHADLSALQRDWLRNRYLEKRNVAVIVGSPRGAVILRNLDWEHPIDPSTLTLADQDVANWIVGEVYGKKNAAARDCGKGNDADLPPRRNKRTIGKSGHVSV